MAPPSLKRPNSQVCRNLFGFSRLDLNAFFFTEVRRCPRSDSGRFLTWCRNHFLNAIYVKAGEEEAFFIGVRCFYWGFLLDTGGGGGFIVFFLAVFESAGVVFCWHFGLAGWFFYGLILMGAFYYFVVFFFWGWGKRKAGRLEPPRLGVSVDLGELFPWRFSFWNFVLLGLFLGFFLGFIPWFFPWGLG